MSVAEQGFRKLGRYKFSFRCEVAGGCHGPGSLNFVRLARAQRMQLPQRTPCALRTALVCSKEPCPAPPPRSPPCRYMTRARYSFMLRLLCWLEQQALGKKHGRC